MSAREFSRMVKLDRVPAEALTIEASAAECAALAERFELPAIRALQAVLSFVPRGDAIEANGRLTALFDQRCAISDEPFTNSLAEEIAYRFVPTLAAAAEDEEIELPGDEPDEIEYDGAAIDVGEAVAQSFGLALDPYAIGPDAESARRRAGIVDEDAPSGPFAALAALKPKAPDA